MKNTINKGKVSFLVIGYEDREGKYKNKYIGICREFGFIEEGNSAEAVEKRLRDSAILLLKTVRENPRLEPSLNVRPPIKYLILFYIAPLIIAMKSIVHKFNGDIHLKENDIPHLLAHPGI